jgi:hypothetical protein
VFPSHALQVQLLGGYVSRSISFEDDLKKGSLGSFHEDRTVASSQPIALVLSRMQVEDDEMEVNEFVAKIRTWLKLLALES